MENKFCKRSESELQPALVMGRETDTGGRLDTEPVVVLRKVRGLGRMHSPYNILQSVMHRFLKGCHTAVFCGELLQSLHPQSFTAAICSDIPVLGAEPCCQPNLPLCRRPLTPAVHTAEGNAEFTCLRTQTDCCPKVYGKPEVERGDQKR